MLKRNIFLDCDMQNLLQFEGIYGPIGYRKNNMYNTYCIKEQWDRGQNMVLIRELFQNN